MKKKREKITDSQYKLPHAPEDWQIRQKHHEDVFATHRKLGHLDNKNQVRRFNGTAFFPEIRKLGHTSNLLETCECWNKRTATKKEGA